LITYFSERCLSIRTNLIILFLVEKSHTKRNLFRVFLCQKKKTDFYACKGYVLFKFYCVHSVFFIESNITFVLTTILENHKKDRSRKNLSYNLFFPVPLLRPITLAMFFYSIALLNIHDYPIILHVDQKIVMKV